MITRASAGRTALQRHAAFLQAIDEALRHCQRLHESCSTITGVCPRRDRRHARVDVADHDRREAEDISSHSISLGLAISARPIATICCCPPDRESLGWWRCSARTGTARKGAAATRGPGRPSSPPIKRFSSTEERAETAAALPAPARCRAPPLVAGPAADRAPSRITASGRAGEQHRRCISTTSLSRRHWPHQRHASPAATRNETPNSA